MTNNTDIYDDEHPILSENSGMGFQILFALQFLLVVVNMTLDVKIGLLNLALTIIIIGVMLFKNNYGPNAWQRAKNGMVLVYTIWTVFCFVEIANPNHVQGAWNISATHYFVIPIFLGIIIPMSFRSIKAIEILLIIWSVFILIASFKGYWQRSHGFSQKDLFFLYNEGGFRTHFIWSGIRYFSCLGNAANYGVHTAMAIVTFGISLFYVKNTFLKIYFALIVAASIYSVGISGTRSAIAIPAVALLLFILISRNWKSFLVGSVTLIAFFAFFNYTTIGDSNEYIRKMRSAFKPTEDTSYLVREENRKKMKTLMAEKPFGYGLGLSKGERFEPKEIMPYPPDSWFVAVWVETGIVGLVLYLLLHTVLIVWAAWILVFKVKNKQLRGLLAAWLCMDAGFLAAAYVNDVMQYPSTFVFYTGIALCFAGPYIDEQIKIKDEQIKAERGYSDETEELDESKEPIEQ